MPSFDPDFSRNRAHELYRQAANAAAQAGAYTQDALLDAYKNLLENPFWEPDEGWAPQHQEGVEMYVPSLTQRKPVTFEAAAPAAFASGAYTEEAAPRAAFDEWARNPEDLKKTEDLKALNPNFKSGYEAFYEATHPEHERPEYTQEERDRIDRAAWDLEDEFWHQDPKLPDLTSYNELEGEENYVDKYVSSLMENPDSTDARDLYNAERPKGEPVKTAIPREEIDEMAMNPDSPLFEKYSEDIPAMDYWGYFLGSDKDRARINQRLQYRKDHPIANGGGVMNEEMNQKYKDYWDSLGGIDESYTPSKTFLNSALENTFTQDPLSFQTVGELDNWLSDYINWASRAPFENMDRGDRLTWDAVKSPWMSGAQYKKYITELGTGGRPLDQIDDYGVYNKIDEMNDYNFVPYIEDWSQLADWTLTNGANSVSKVFNNFKNARDRFTDRTVTRPDGSEIDLDDFTNASKTQHYGQAPISYTLKGYDKPLSIEDMNNMEKPISSEERQSVIFNLPNGDTVEYPYKDLAQMGLIVKDEDQDYSLDLGGLFELNAKPLEYTQWDGQEISISPEEYYWLANNIAKDRVNYKQGAMSRDQSQRRELAEIYDEMLRGDFSGAEDIAPAFVDILLGSSPLFYGPTAWTNSIANGIVNSTGVNPNQYNARTNEYTWQSDNPNVSDYFSSVALNTAIPVTERLAGGLGGSHGIFGKPIQVALDKHNAGALPRIATDIVGEGVEEVVANLWEEVMNNGFSNWYANPVYERNEDGSIKEKINPRTLKPEFVEQVGDNYKTVYDPNTPVIDRWKNFGEDAREAFSGGVTLAAPLTFMKLPGQAITHTGYFDKYRNTRPDKIKIAPVKITEDDLGSFWTD